MGSLIPTKWNWTGQRLKAAKLMAVGDFTQEEVAKECRVTRETINVWNKVPEFHEKVVELVLADERATKAGILKRALRTLEAKADRAAEDKTTELEYLKFIADLMGLTEKQAGVNIINAVGITNTPEVKQASEILCKRIRETLDAEPGE